jgi:predicted RNA-binding Zn ribbon-like protein
MAYAGPLRDEPISVELHNTLYIAGGVERDGLSHAWLDALGDRLPAERPWPRREELVGLRDAVRSALQAAVLDTPQDAAALDALNRASALAPQSPTVSVSADGVLVAGAQYHGASRAKMVLAAFARDAIDVLTGLHELRMCGAPGCILLFVKDHPRREWCSNACGNRARQARHYDRVRRRRAQDGSAAADL